MKWLEWLPNGFGGFYLNQASVIIGPFLAFFVIMTVIGAIFANLLDLVYEEYGGIIIKIFIVSFAVLLLYLLTMRTGNLFFGIVIPATLAASLFTYYLIAAYLYNTPYPEDAGAGLKIFFLLGIYSSLALALIGGVLITLAFTFLIKIILTIFRIKIGVNSESVRNAAN